jgi:hypothetical protein
MIESQHKSEKIAGLASRVQQMLVGVNYFLARRVSGRGFLSRF